MDTHSLPGPRIPPAWMPLALCSLTAACAEEATLWMPLGPSQHALVRAAGAASCVILMATRRHWNNDRRAFEGVAFVVLLSAALAVGRALPFAAEAILLLCVCLAVPAFAAWRFMPDSGQSGQLWAWTEGVRRGGPVLCAACALALASAGCARKAPEAPAPGVHPIRGVIVSVDPKRHVLVVHHEDIAGYMPSMTMEFPVAGADMSAFAEGNRIEGRLIDDHKGNLSLEGVRVVDPVGDQIVQAAEKSLGQDTVALGRDAYRDIGDRAPEFSLYDQDNHVVSASQFRGKRIVLNFIYTRCPVATMCPASTAKMMQIQAGLAQRGITGVQLITISLDPAFDTPPVLKRYASERGIDTRNFSFLTGPEQAVRNLMVAFGILAVPGENLYKHTLATVLIDETGKVRFREEGSNWLASDFLDRLGAR